MAPVYRLSSSLLCDKVKDRVEEPCIYTYPGNISRGLSITLSPTNEKPSPWELGVANVVNATGDAVGLPARRE